MNITIIASGTRGDVQPAVAFGKALLQRGHSVRLLASPNFHSWIERHGLETARSNVNIQAIMESEGGVDWVERGHNPLVQTRLMKRLLDKWGQEIIREAWQACQDADVVISSFTSDVYVTAIAEKLGVPQISMALQPVLIASRDGRAVMNAPRSNRHSILNYWLGKLLIETVPWQLLGKQTNRLRRELGLPPQSAKENRLVRQRLLTLAAYSEHVVPQPEEWPPNVHTTGYWFLDNEGEWQPPGALRAFLDAGSPPVFIGFGSMTGRNPVQITTTILDAVQLTGQRAIIASGWAGLGGAGLRAGVFRLESAPHDWLFPRMAAVVHHGGAGTTAAGIRAGVPTIIVPHMADQPFWGQRVAALGVGPEPLWRHKLTADRLAERINQTIGDPQMKQRAAALGAKIRDEDGVGRAVTLFAYVEGSG